MFRGQDPAFCHPTQNEDFGTIIYVPVRFETRTLGLLCIVWNDIEDFALENIALLSAVAERLGSAIQNRDLRKQAEQAAVLEERQRLARELHDSVTQSLYSLTLLAEAGKDLASRHEPASTAKLLDCLDRGGNRDDRDVHQGARATGRAGHRQAGGHR